MDDKTKRRDVYSKITEHIVAAIERGAPTFEMPWHHTGASLARPTNAETGKPYLGVNIISLWASASQHAFFSDYWATYRQWQNLNAQVMRGEKASIIVFYKEMTKDVWDEATGETTEERYLMARTSWVFNADQVHGWQTPFATGPDPIETIEEADAVVAATGADIRHGGAEAAYVPSDDYIIMPARPRFTGTTTTSATEGYYATLLHELTHWTSHPTRLDRDLAGQFGSDAYAMEELVAELGAAFLCAELSITNTPRVDHAAYIAHWLKVLKSDKRAVFTAASKASAAARFVGRFREEQKKPRRLPIPQ